MAARILTRMCQDHSNRNQTNFNHSRHPIGKASIAGALGAAIALGLGCPAARRVSMTALPYLLKGLPKLRGPALIVGAVAAGEGTKALACLDKYRFSDK